MNAQLNIPGDIAQAKYEDDQARLARACADVTVTLTARQATEVLRGLAKQTWTWDHNGSEARRYRADNDGAWNRLIAAGAVAPVPAWYVSGNTALDTRRALLAARDAQPEEAAYPIDDATCKDKGFHVAATRHIAVECGYPLENES